MSTPHKVTEEQKHATQVEVLKSLLQGKALVHLTKEVIADTVKKSKEITDAFYKGAS